jgi:energy-coupling factor transporter ATP-binding protein EcfA2
MTERRSDEPVSTAAEELQSPVPVLVALLGPPGSGKTTLGKTLEILYPDEFTFMSIGEEMRNDRSTTADGVVEEIMNRAMIENIPFAVIDGSFSPDSLLHLRDLVSTVLIIHLDVDVDLCQKLLFLRGADRDTIASERLSLWEQKSSELFSVAKRLGCVSLRPNVVFFDDEESKNSAIAEFSKKRKTCIVDLGLGDGHDMRNREFVDNFCGRKSEGTGGEAASGQGRSVTEIVSS